MLCRVNRDRNAGHSQGRADGLFRAVQAQPDVDAVELRRDLHMRLNAVRAGAVTAGYLRYGSAVRLGTVDAGNYHVNIPGTGRCEQRCASGEPVFAGPGQAAVFLPGYPADLRWGAACAQLCLMIDRHELELELQRQIGRPLGERRRGRGLRCWLCWSVRRTGRAGSRTTPRPPRTCRVW